MTERKTVVYPNPQVLAEAVAARTLLTIIDLLAEPNRKRVDIAVTGGTDGNRVFVAMNASPLNDAVDWSRGDVRWGDERFVAADDDDRNAKQAREAWYGALVESGRMPAANIHVMPADTRGAEEIAAASPEQTDAVLAEAAAEYQRELIEQLGENPALDIAMFGMGRRAFRVPRFPTTARPRSTTRTCWSQACAIRQKPPPLRLTLTVPMIARSKHTWVFTSEERKAGAVKAAFAQRNNPHAPSSYADGEELLWSLTRVPLSKL